MQASLSPTAAPTTPTAAPSVSPTPAPSAAPTLRSCGGEATTAFFRVTSASPTYTCTGPTTEVQGTCFTTNNGQCVTDGPGNYGNNERCTIEVLRDSVVGLYVAPPHICIQRRVVNLLRFAEPACFYLSVCADVTLAANKIDACGLSHVPHSSSFNCTLMLAVNFQTRFCVHKPQTHTTPGTDLHTRINTLHRSLSLTLFH
jgi:hypothetical protein